MSLSLIKPIKLAILSTLQTNQAALGLKTVTKDLPTEGDDPVQMLIKLAGIFPAAIVDYYGRTGRNDGKYKIYTQTYAIVVVGENFKGPFASTEATTDLMESINYLIDGQILDKTTQRTELDFIQEAMLVKQQSIAVFQMLFNVETARRRLA